MPVPVSLTRWLASAYPTLDIDPQWLSDCHDYITSTFPDQTLQQLIKAVEGQLLMSDLRDSISPPGPLETLRTDDDDLFDLTKSRGILLQITSVTDIGHSAIALRDTQAKRMEERKGAPAIVGNVEETTEGPTKFPRGMLSMELNDGHTTIRAIEYDRIADLEMGEVPLGAKLVLKGTRVRRGMALLTPATIVYKGHRVDEMESNADAAFEQDLQARLDAQAEARAPLQPRASALPGAPKGKGARKPAPAPRPAPMPPKPVIDIDTTLDVDDFLDDDLFDAVDQAEQEALATKLSQQRNLKLDVHSDDELWAGMDEDEIWPEDEMVAPTPTARAKRKAPSIISLSSE